MDEIGTLNMNTTVAHIALGVSVNSIELSTYLKGSSKIR